LHHLIERCKPRSIAALADEDHLCLGLCLWRHRSQRAGRRRPGPKGRWAGEARCQPAHQPPLQTPIRPAKTDSLL
jgi:hypothetical protein